MSGRCRRRLRCCVFCWRGANSHRQLTSMDRMGRILVLLIPILCILDSRLRGNDDVKSAGKD